MFCCGITFNFPNKILKRNALNRYFRWSNQYWRTVTVCFFFSIVICNRGNLLIFRRVICADWYVSPRRRPSITISNIPLPTGPVNTVPVTFVSLWPHFGVDEYKHVRMSVLNSRWNKWFFFSFFLSSRRRVLNIEFSSGGIVRTRIRHILWTPLCKRLWVIGARIAVYVSRRNTRLV